MEYDISKEGFFTSVPQYSNEQKIYLKSMEIICYGMKMKAGSNNQIIY